MRKLALAAFVLSSAAFAGQPGREGVLFSRLNLDSRLCSLGIGAFAVSEGPSALFANPAASVLSSGVSLQASHLAWLERFNGETIAAQAPVGEYAALGGSVFLFSHESIEVTTEELPDGTGQLSSILDVEASIAASQWVREDAAAGAAIRVLREKLGGQSTVATAVDAGVIWVLNPEAILGLSLRGLGRLFRDADLRDPFPFSADAGLRYEVPYAPARIYCGVRLSPFSPSSLGLGAELGEVLGTCLRSKVELREGAKVDLGAGLGVRKDMWNLDFAYIPVTDLGSAFRVTLTLKFARKKSL